MTGCIRFKDGVLPLATLAPAGVRLLGAIEETARRLKRVLTITCADKDHPPDDPHTLGEAFDIRTHDLDAPVGLKQTLLKELLLTLSDDPLGMDQPMPLSNGGIATMRFFGWIEHQGQADEHLHVQRRHGVTYP